MSKNRRPYNIIRQVVYALLGTIYAVGLVYLLFFTRRRWEPAPKPVNLVLFKEKIHHWQTRENYTRPQNEELYKDVIGNVLLFVPFPFFLCFFFRIRTFSRLLLISIASSVLIETTQYLLNAGVADVDDLVLNTVGALSGLLILFGIFLRKKHKSYHLLNKWRTADEL